MKNITKSIITLVFAFALLMGIHQLPYNVYAASAKKTLSTPSISEKTDVSGYIQLKWKDDKKATLTYIYRKASGEKKYTQIGSTKTNTYKDKTAKINKKYTYYIKSYAKISKKKVYSKNSKTVTVTKYKPAKVAEVKASAKKLNQVSLSWEAVSGADGYRVYRSTTQKGNYKKVASVKTNKYTDKSVQNFSTYYYKICAYNKASGKTYFGSYSTVLKRTTKKGLSTPKITKVTESSTGFKLEWTDDKMSQYTFVYRLAEGDSEYTCLGYVEGNTYTDKAILRGKRYTYCVLSDRMYNGKDCYSEFSPSYTAVSTYPGTVRDLKGSYDATEDEIDLKWSSVKNADEYYIYRRTSKNGDYEWRGMTVNNYFTDPTVDEGTTYYYSIVGVKKRANGNHHYGYLSNEVTIKVSSTPTTTKPTTTKPTTTRPTTTRPSSSSSDSYYPIITTKRTCTYCGGRGRVDCASCTGGRYYDSINNQYRPCVSLRCSGGYKECLHCFGTGKVG